VTVGFPRGSGWWRGCDAKAIMGESRGEGGDGIRGEGAMVVGCEEDVEWVIVVGCE
jgi:hypothetical protein